ncbi:hypothetical protein HY970_02645 [Candidatus Kaiserbacteria bacterium]|nr:hypothetical protein [Candidatus Kaiserbacteria bacterium]
MLGLSNSPRAERSIVVVDVVPGGVGAAILSLTPDGSAHIIASHRSMVTLEVETPEHSIAALGERMDAVLGALRSARPTLPISEVYCVIHSPWARSSMVSSKSEYTGPTEIDQHAITDTARASMKDARGIDLKNLFEARAVRIWLNGYPVQMPEGKQAQTLEIVSLLSDLDPELRSSIEVSVHHTFANAKVVFRSAIRTFLDALARIPSADGSYLVVDMGVDATEIVSVRDSAIAGTRTVSEGLRTILARVAPDRPVQESLSTIRMLLRDACEGEACNQIREAIAKAEPELVRIFGEVIGELAAGERVANKLVLIAHEDLQEWLEQFFTRIDFTQFTLTTLPFVTYAMSSADSRVYAADASHLDTALHFDAALVNIDARSE